MSEAHMALLISDEKKGTLEPEQVKMSRAEWVDLERQLISLLVTVQRALGKEPSVITRAERRRG